MQPVPITSFPCIKCNRNSSKVENFKWQKKIVASYRLQYCSHFSPRRDELTCRGWDKIVDILWMIFLNMYESIGSNELMILWSKFNSYKILCQLWWMQLEECLAIFIDNGLMSRWYWVKNIMKDEWHTIYQTIKDYDLLYPVYHWQPCLVRDKIGGGRTTRFPFGPRNVFIYISHSAAQVNY